ncbi:MAG: ABC transporter ATP-binding protein [Candidatus Acetothermia bacterium]
MADNSLLVAKDLQKWYEVRKWGLFHAGYVQAVDQVSFELNRRKTTVLVGESGCGKTTLAKTIIGLEKPTGGELLFDDKPLHGDSSDLNWFRSQMGYIQQDPYEALPPFMNIRRILLEPLIINQEGSKSERDQQVKDALTEVKLTPVEEFLPKYPHMLSGGEQQRVVIARALAVEPQLLMADEPVSMLDPSVQVEILDLLREIQEDYNLASMYITHDLSTTRYFSQYAMVMYAGKLVEKAQIDELIQHPLHPYLQALIKAIPDPKAENAKIMMDVPPGEPPSLLNPPTGCRFSPRCPEAIDGKCDKEDPPEFEPRPGHYTKCWLYEEDEQQST